MGLIPKYKREKQKLIRREAKAAKKRGEKVRSKIVRFLIVCEGSETEPNYLNPLLPTIILRCCLQLLEGEDVLHVRW